MRHCAAYPHAPIGTTSRPAIIHVQHLYYDYPGCRALDDISFALAQAIVHKPKVLLLDEPGSGLDPESRSSLSILMKKLASDGMTLLISSHILAELESYCTAMLVLREGRLLAHQRLDHGEASLGTASPQAGAACPMRLRLVGAQRERLPELQSCLLARGCPATMEENATILFEGPVDDTAQAALLRDLLADGWQIAEYASQALSLQDVYLRTIAEPAQKGE